MANNQNKDRQGSLGDELNDDEKGFEVTNQGQNLGGGKDERTIDVGGTSDADEFSKTDQSIAQAAPGQTMNSTNQGSSNA